jgi:GNAT superfamily N-acetyltransferase
MTAEVRRIARMRFGTEYWPAIDAALQHCLESHSVVISSTEYKPNIAAFVLVCPPTTGSKTAYGIEHKVPSQSLEIAFVATDEGWEGHGFARSLLEAVLFRCKTAQQSAWLHVDTINPKAHAFYERLGFRDFLHTPDPFGSPGVVMFHSLFGRPLRYSEAIQWTTLLNAPPCESEEPFRRSILTPPTMACV